MSANGNYVTSSARTGKHGLLAEWRNLEEMMNARFADLVLNIARWAFEEGRKYPGVSGM